MEQKPRVWPVFAAFLFAVALAIVTLGIAIAQLRGAGVLHDGDRGVPLLLTTIGATQGALLLAALLFARPLTRARFRLHAGVRGRPLVAVIVGTLALGMSLEALAKLTGFFDGSVLAQLESALYGARGLPLVVLLLFIGPLPGFAEELFFRGFMQTRLRERWAPKVALVTTSVLFALIHFDLVHSPLALCLGLWLGFAVDRLGSLWVGIIAHVVNNSIATLFLAVGDPMRSSTARVVAAVLGALVFAAAWRLLVRTPQPPPLGERQPASA